MTSLGACSDAKKPRIDEELLRRGLGGEPSTLDPLLAADNFSFEVLRDVYEGLTTEAPNGDVVPGVASSWKIDPSGKQYTFQIRPDARWSNGRPVLADDFVAAWRRVVDPRKASPVADNLRIIKGASEILSGAAPPDTLGVVAPSHNVLIINLEQPAPYLPQLLTQSAAYPIYSDASATSRNPKLWVSNGAYVLSSWAPGTTVELIRNPDYWDRLRVQIARVQYQIAEENSQFARYRAGQLDMTDTVPATALKSLREGQPSELQVAPFLATAYYGLNLSAQPLAANIKIRQAIAMAIDRKRLVSSLGFGQGEAFGFVPPGIWNYSPQAWEWEKLSEADRVAEARRLYAEAGYSAARPLHLRLLFNSNPVIKNTAVVVAGMWKEVLGIETTFSEEEYRVFLQSRHDKSKWEIARLGWTADYNDASNFLDIFRQRSSNNDSGYVNPAYDRMLDSAAETSQASDRRPLLEASERLMLSEYPIVPLYFFVSKRLVKPNLLGYQANPLNHIESKSLHFSAY
jgi:oligopeptide transport system substrate-binding protein